MADDFDRILDQCIDRINRGDSLEDCLAEYSSYAERLKPLLQSMCSVQKTYAFTPSADAKRASRQRFHAALEQGQPTKPVFTFIRLIPRPAVWATIAVVILAIVVVWGIIPALNPAELASSPEGNFAFLISDEPNDIGDFESLVIAISRVGLQTAGDSADWIEFTPETKNVDLTQLQGEQSQEIWRGDIPTGQYSQVFIHVSDVNGKLKSTGQTIEVKLPGNKLHISKSFDIVTDTVTSFTFDITVMATGNNGKYILKPQINESGVQQEQKSLEQKPDGIKGKGKN